MYKIKVSTYLVSYFFLPLRWVTITLRPSPPAAVQYVIFTAHCCFTEAANRNPSCFELTALPQMKMMQFPVCRSCR